jgi:hypothetical protein
MTKGRQKTYSAFLQKNFNPESLSLNFLFRPDAPPVTLEKIKEVICNDQPKDDDSESFKSNIPVNISPVKKEKIKYFEIVRVVRQKKRGKRRLKNNSKLHDIYSDYNIICKIKVYFTRALIKQAYYLYKKNHEEDKLKGEEFLVPINLKEKKNKKGRHLNVDWFFKTAKEYLSSNISGKYNAHDEDHNKKKIDEIFKENKRKDLINFLEQNVNTIYKEYISIEESQNEIFKGLTKIYTDLDIIKSKKGYEEAYINKIKGISADLEKILSNKKGNNNKIKEKR